MFESWCGKGGPGKRGGKGGPGASSADEVAG